MLRLTACWKTVLLVVFLSVSTGVLPAWSQDEFEGAVVEGNVVVEIPFYSIDTPEELVKDRLQCLQNEIHMTYNPQVKSFIDYFSKKNKNYLTIMESRKNVYFPIFEEYLKKHNMPDELKYLSIVESGLNPKAMSRVGAAGLWQFMPATGKIFDLKQDVYNDDRLDPYKSTEAACLYLKQLYKMFGDWQLALASYNCGPGNVRKAIRKSGYKDGFWEVYNHLPRETRSYVPQFIAVMYVMNNLNEYGLQTDSLEYAMAFDTIQINKTINLDVFCDQLGICKDDLMKLNPSLRRDILPGYLNYSLRVPADMISTLQENRVAILDSAFIAKEERVAFEETVQPSKTYYTVRQGDYLGKIADKNKVSVSQLQKWNNLSKTTVHVGQRLVIYSKQASATYADTKPGKATTQNASTKVEANPVVSNTHHIVKSGENLHLIAQKYQVSLADLRSWNNLSTTVIHVGQKLLIQTASEESTVTVSQDLPKFYMVQPGDTLWSISKKYTGLTVEEIKKMNNLKDENIKPGMKLILS